MARCVSASHGPAGPEPGPGRGGAKHGVPFYTRPGTALHGPARPCTALHGPSPPRHLCCARTCHFQSIALVRPACPAPRRPAPAAELYHYCCAELLVGSVPCFLSATLLSVCKLDFLPSGCPSYSIGHQAALRCCRGRLLGAAGAAGGCWGWGARAWGSSGEHMTTPLPCHCAPAAHTEPHARSPSPSSHLTPYCPFTSYQ